MFSECTALVSSTASPFDRFLSYNVISVPNYMYAVINEIGWTQSIINSINTNANEPRFWDKCHAEWLSNKSQPNIWKRFFIQKHCNMSKCGIESSKNNTWRIKETKPFIFIHNTKTKYTKKKKYIWLINIVMNSGYLW